MSQILKLVERQTTAARLRRNLEEDETRAGRHVTKEGVGFGPCVLISRECGSGSSTLAEQVGARLEWTVFDSKIVDEIAKSAHVQRRLIESVDEHFHSSWDAMLNEILLDGFSDSEYLRHLGRVIMALGHQGNVVLVGRGAEYFLPSKSALRVRLVGPVDCRAQRVAERMGASLAEARFAVERVDHERASFVRKVFRRNPYSMLNHDLIINTGEIKVEDAVEIVLAGLQAKLGLPVRGDEQTREPAHAH